MQLLALENASTTYSLTGQLEYNVSNEDDKHWLYQMFVTYYCGGCSAAPLTQNKNNEIKQELTKEKYFFGNDSDERLYIDMRRSKGYTNELEKQLRLRVIAYSQAEYWYTSANKGYIMTCKDYSIAKDDDIAA